MPRCWRLRPTGIACSTRSVAKFGACSEARFLADPHVGRSLCRRMMGGASPDSGVHQAGRQASALVTSADDRVVRLPLTSPSTCGHRYPSSMYACGHADSGSGQSEGWRRQDRHRARPRFGRSADAGEFTTGDVLYADAKGIAADAIVKTAWGDAVSCIPANLALAERDADVSLGSEFRLRKALTGVGGFDLVLIDCPPSVGRLVTNGLVAADRALVVTQAAAPSLMGVANVMATVDVVREHYNPGLAVAGIVVNLLPPRQRETDYRLAELVDAFGPAVWEPYVPQRVVVAESMGAAAPVHDCAGRTHCLGDDHTLWDVRLPHGGAECVDQLGEAVVRLPLPRREQVHDDAGDGQAGVVVLAHDVDGGHDVGHAH